MNPIRYFRILLLEKKARVLSKKMEAHNESIDSINRLNPYDCVLKMQQYYDAKREFTKVSNEIWALKYGL
jgi:hypothetical protein